MQDVTITLIQDRLTAYFNSESRKIVFWLDPEKQWISQIDSFSIANAKLIVLQDDNQFKTKYEIEYEDTQSSFLIYSNYTNEYLKNCPLTDTMLYSKLFQADSISMIADKLSIKDEETKEALKKYKEYIQDIANQQRLVALHYDQYQPDTVPLAIMCAICQYTSVSVQGIITKVLGLAANGDKSCIDEFIKYNLIDDFWNICRNYFNWQETSPNLDKLIQSLYLSYLKKDLGDKIPESTTVRYATSSNLVSFFDFFKGSEKESYLILASDVATQINIKSVIGKIPIDALVSTSVFREIDETILSWILNRLIDRDTGAEAAGKSIEKICQERQRKDYGGEYSKDYELLKFAALFLSVPIEKNYPSNIGSFLDAYTKIYYKTDLYYRKFILLYNELIHKSQYEPLKERIENIYTNDYLQSCLPAWNDVYKRDYQTTEAPRIRKFYSQHIKNGKEKVAVIISDALRYEVAEQLFEELNNDQNLAVTMEARLGELPSFTALGMAALLPHKTLSLDASGAAFVDGNSTDSLLKRETILQKENPQSKAISFNDLSSKSRDGQRDVFKGMNIVYIYHNQIDIRGEASASENEVFVACEEAVKEILKEVKRLSGSANIYKFIITADHGFIYKRDKITESDKIAIPSDALHKDRRFLITNKEITNEGIISLPLAKLLNNDSKDYIAFPISANVLKTQGGQNYVHGGSSPQELIVPVITIKAEKGRVETSKAEITVIGPATIRVSNLVTSFEFIQSEPVSDEIKNETFKIYIIDKDGNPLSDVHEHKADSKEHDPKNRMFRYSFTLKNTKYSSKENYFLLIKTDDYELSRHPLTIDIPFADGFNFF
ncbi:BREX-1 system phosphatase PglZ type A [Treponema primitia]|uniref:BREX-1 system phosphatase PglZ type A n=1 Tax=Treponema primitia TaxID=88058 RepID=UPI00397E9759